MKTWLSLICAGVLLAPVSLAHFRLLEPASWIEESEVGDPQWAPPCGGKGDDHGKPTGKVTSVTGGEKLRVRIREMAFHPGFYRVALAVNSRAELPADPEAWTEPGPTGPRAVSGAIHFPLRAPVLADGLFLHTAAFDKDQEADIEIPNINCSKCTLQVVAFMAEHGRNAEGDFTYHHCAVLKVQANPAKAIDGRFPVEKK